MIKNLTLYAPFIALLILFPVNFLGNTFIYPWAGLSESSGQAVADGIVSLGLFIGIVGAFINTTLPWHWRLVIVLTFIPVVATSYTVSGLCCL